MSPHISEHITTALDTVCAHLRNVGEAAIGARPMDRQSCGRYLDAVRAEAQNLSNGDLRIWVRLEVSGTRSGWGGDTPTPATSFGPVIVDDHPRPIHGRSLKRVNTLGLDQVHMMTAYDALHAPKRHPAGLAVVESIQVIGINAASY